MNGIPIRVSKSNPCPICGSTDYDIIYDYGSEGMVIWCHKMPAQETVLRGGTEFVCIKQGKESKIGIFNLYKERNSYEEGKKRYIEEKKKNNPQWKPSSKGASRKPFIKNNCSFENLEVKEDVVPLSNEELDVRYRYFLSLLVLEQKHRRLLLNEWKSDVFPEIGENLLKIYPIKSLPPKDIIRFKSSDQFENPTRKKIMEAMLKKFGTVKGIPGFYCRTGDYWDAKPENERWTFSGNEGIIFPTMDKDGYVYRLRYREDYPNYKVKSGGETYQGMYGVFSHRYSDNGMHQWWFYPSEDDKNKNPILANVPLNNGLPSIGHAQGKYKTLSSWKDKVEGKYIVNGMLGGCRSGAPYSLYVPHTKRDSYPIAILTEGEKKAMIGCVVKNCPVVSFAGVGTYSVLFAKDMLGKSLYDKLTHDYGVKFFIICYDADKESNGTVKNAEAGLAKLITEAGSQVLIGDWSGKFDKGLDDILLMGIDIITRKSPY